jgi:endonuclease/exonuclease/phosphatase family metal-dependent hydrolase
MPRAAASPARCADLRRPAVSIRRVRPFAAAVLALLTIAATSSAQTLPMGWSAKDVGAVAATGSATAVNSIFTIAGSGADVWGSKDEFRFAYTMLSGDGSIVSQVTTLDDVHDWVKAGVMMRETLSASSRHAFMLVSADRGLAFQRRASTGGSSTHTAAGSGGTPYYVKLTRAGSTFTAFKSLDGVGWTKIASQSISMASTIYVGLAVSSHVDGVLVNATFAKTVVAGATSVAPVPPPPAPAPAPAPISTSTTRIRVMHWNLHHGNDPNNRWAFPRQMDVIYKARPDVISLNEVEKFNSTYGNIDQAAEIARHLASKTGQTWYQYMVVGSGSSRGIGNAIISRFPLSGGSVCQLSSNRNAVHASMTVNGRTINLWSTHLAVESGTYRVAEVKVLLPCMSGYAQQRVVAGDFNASTSTIEIELMTAGYVDGWAKAKSLGVATNYAGNCDGCTRNSRIDYLFASKEASNLVLKAAEIIDTRDANGVMASDHKPMVITFEVK